MSWNVTIGPVENNGRLVGNEAIMALHAATIPENQGPNTPERDAQFEAAITAAENIILVHAVGLGLLRISLAGHSNSNQAQGNSVSVSVYNQGDA